MNSWEIFKNAFATIVSILAIYRFFYVARYAKKDGKMRVLRTLLITAAFLLTVGGVATVVLINFWGVALLFVGGVCLFIDGRLAKFDLDPQEQTIVDKFMAHDVETRNLILQAVESNRRVVVREGTSRPVTIDDEIYFYVDPLDVRETAAQGFLIKVDEVETKQIDGDGGVEFAKCEYYTVHDDARFVARYVKNRGWIDEYGLMPENVENAQNVKQAARRILEKFDVSLSFAADWLLDRFELAHDKDVLLDQFFSYDVPAQNLLLKAVATKERVVLREDSDHPVILGDALRFDKVLPIEVRKIAEHGLLTKDCEIEEKFENDDGVMFDKIEYFKTNNNTRFVARYVKKKGMVDKYGLMKFDP